MIIRPQETDTIDIEGFRFEEITIADDDGLHSWLDIEQFYQSEDGAIWAQVNEGVFRYNGHSAVNVTRYLSTKNLRLDDQAVTRFLFDNEGNLWLGRRKGLFKINHQSKKIQKVYLDEPNHSSNWRNYILELEAHQDTIYVGSANGLYLVNQKSGEKINSYLTNGKDVKHRESSKSVQSILPNLEKDVIWVALMDGLYRIDKKKGTHERFLITSVWPDTLAHNFNRGHLIENNLIMPGYGIGMVEFNVNSKTFKRHPTSPIHSNDYTYNIIRSAIKLSDSTFLINATKMGNAIFNVNTKKYSWLPTPDIFKDGVYLYLDRSGYVWGAKRGRIFKTIKPIKASNGTKKNILDVSAVYTNGRLIHRPSIDGYKVIELAEGEENIRIDYSLTEPYLFQDIKYEYQLDNQNWQKIDNNNILELFGLKSGKHDIALRAKDKNAQILASTKIPLNLIVPFYKTPLFFGLLAFVLLLLSYFFLNYLNQRAITKKLKQLDTAKSNFFTNISHELRTPLSLIKGPIEQHLGQNEISNANEDLQIALKNANRLQELVNQILDLSKLESGYYKLNVSQNNFPQFLKSLTSSFDYAAKKKNHTLKVSIDDNEETAWYDKEVLHKVVTNLLDNAVKYSPKGSLIEFLGKIMANKLVLTFKNIGTSLTKEERDHIFQRYYRSADAQVGTGIGLALTKELVELHKGTITVESNDNRVVFIVKIPTSKSSYDKNEFEIGGRNEHASIVLQHMPVETSGKTNEKKFKKKDLPILLLVEDNEELQQFVAALFKENFNVILAENGKKGFDLAKKHVPDIIITDLMMPKEDGITMTKNCKSEDTTSHIPIIMLTAKAGDENELIGLETGADGYITKPFNTEILKQKVGNLLEVQKNLQERFSKEIVLTPQEISINSYDERFLIFVQDVLDNQLTDSGFSANTFAKALGMSRMQLHRKLKAMTGQTTTEFIRTQRLKLAADLLKTSDVNVSEIGYRVGFNNHSYFTKCFKEHYGITPNAFAGA